MEAQVIKKLLILGTINIAAFMFSQDTVHDTISARNKVIDEVVITGNSNPKSSIKTSTSISTSMASD